MTDLGMDFPEEKKLLVRIHSLCIQLLVFEEGKNGFPPRVMTAFDPLVHGIWNHDDSDTQRSSLPQLLMISLNSSVEFLLTFLSRWMIYIGEDVMLFTIILNPKLPRLIEHVNLQLSLGDRVDNP